MCVGRCFPDSLVFAAILSGAAQVFYSQLRVGIRIHHRKEHAAESNRIC
ncbi:hypothetical protein [Pantoea piersonii]|nr:hypothetical protein [Pantoea piersonii]